MSAVCLLYGNFQPFVFKFAVLTTRQSSRVCAAMAVLQAAAAHPESRHSFLSAHIPLYLYPFLHTVSKDHSFEYLRLTSLGIICAMLHKEPEDVAVAEVFMY